MVPVAIFCISWIICYSFLDREILQTTGVWLKFTVLGVQLAAKVQWVKVLQVGLV
jgi:hypothetical protein